MVIQGPGGAVSGAQAGAQAGVTAPGGSSAAGAAGGGGMSTLATAGTIFSIAGLLNSAIGSFYAAQSKKYQLKSQKLAAEFQKSISNINARAYEREAEYILEAGQKQIGRYTMQAGQQKAAAKASLAARGVQAGVGSTAEIMATGDIVKEIDVYTINANTVRQAEAARMQASNYRTQAAMAGVEAYNLRGASRSLQPWGAAGASLLGGAGDVAFQWAVSKSRAGYSEV